MAEPATSALQRVRPLMRVRWPDSDLVGDADQELPR